MKTLRPDFYRNYPQPESCEHGEVKFSFNECTRLGPHSSERFQIYIIFNSVNSTFFFPLQV